MRGVLTKATWTWREVWQCRSARVLNRHRVYQRPWEQLTSEEQRLSLHLGDLYFAMRPSWFLIRTRCRLWWYLRTLDVKAWWHVSGA